MNKVSLETSRRVGAIAVAILAGSACAATPPPTSPLATWFTGDWAFVESDRPNPCQEGEYGTYAPDGTYRFAGESGIWSLDGASLTETATAIDEVVNAQTADDIGKPYHSTIERASEDRLIKIFPDGRRVAFVRCRETGPRRGDSLG